MALIWRHNGHNGVSNHQPYDCLPNRLFRRRSKKTSKLRVTGLCAGNSPETGEFPAQMASNAENVSIWWCHHAPHREATRHLWPNIVNVILPVLITIQFTFNQNTECCIFGTRRKIPRNNLQNHLIFPKTHKNIPAPKTKYSSPVTSSVYQTKTMMRIN